MPYLGDLIGLFLSELARARAIGDDASKDIAEIYKSDPLLKDFAVPRFRLPNVKVELPILINKLEEDMDLNIGSKFDFNKLKDSYFKVLASSIKDAELKISDALIKNIKKEIEKSFRALKNEPRNQLNAISISKKLTNDTVSVLKTRSKELDIDKVNATEWEKMLKSRILAEIISQKPQPERLTVLANSPEVREFGQNIVHVQLVFSEEGLEWAEIKRNEETSEDKLQVE